MFLKRFKEKSNKKYINKVLDSRKISIDESVLESIGIIFNFDEFYDDEAFKRFVNELGIKDNNIKIVTFISDEKLAVSSWDFYFTPKDFGWRGYIKNIELKQFIDTKFDALISYYNDDNLQLNMVTALSKANFKIGISNTNPRFNDFIINVKSKHLEVFKTETIKYLKVLNKI